MIKIGLIREGKIPPDRRVALSPKQCRKIRETYPHLRMVAQSSPTRAYMDEEYNDNCIVIQEDLSDCDVLFGIKEIPVEDLIDNKTYFLFSHTTKKQPHNKELLKAILDKNIRLIDYELLTDKQGDRLIGFGRFAGLVGTYNGFRGWAIRNHLSEPLPAHTLSNLKELKKEISKLKLDPIKIAFTGEGRVANGVRELLEYMNIREVSMDQYLSLDNFDVPVFVQLTPGDYLKTKDGSEFDFDHLVGHPNEYDSNFQDFTSQTDMLIFSSYWDPASPKLFTKSEMKSKDFRIKLIADITCDIDGSIPSTLRPTTMDDPFYGYNPETGLEENAFSESGNITVMSLDNLPNELPREASKSFGKSLKEYVIPGLFNNDKDGVLERATIARDGKLTKAYKYLEEWVNS